MQVIVVDKIKNSSLEAIMTEDLEFSGTKDYDLGSQFPYQFSKKHAWYVLWERVLIFVVPPTLCSTTLLRCIMYAFFLIWLRYACARCSDVFLLVSYRDIFLCSVIWLHWMAQKCNQWHDSWYYLELLFILDSYCIFVWFQAPFPMQLHHPVQSSTGCSLVRLYFAWTAQGQFSGLNWCNPKRLNFSKHCSQPATLLRKV